MSAGRPTAAVGLGPIDWRGLGRLGDYCISRRRVDAIAKLATGKSRNNGSTSLVQGKEREALTIAVLRDY